MENTSERDLDLRERRVGRLIALAPFDGPEVAAALDAALSDRDWQVRQAAEDLTAATPADDAEPT